MATQPKTSGLTYEDLQAFPDDGLRREIIDGELFVTPSPVRRHQAVALGGEGFQSAQAMIHGLDVVENLGNVYLGLGLFQLRLVFENIHE